MNFNASRSGGGLRKAKRVSDVNAMGGPPPAFNPPPGASGPVSPAAFPAQAGMAQHYHENINFDSSQTFQSSIPPNSNYGFGDSFNQNPMLPGMPNPTQFGAMMQQPIVQDMALQYGQQLAAHGKQLASAQLQRYVPVTKLRYYFAVDTRYVLRKLLLIFFPFTHKEWLVKYNQESPVQPRYDLNAPDLYIPCMGYITYVLIAGFMLGLQQRFSPEQIGMLASSALAYIALELALYVGTLYVSGVGAGGGGAGGAGTPLGTLDLLAYAGYKYAVMIASLLAALVARSTGYYLALLPFSCTLAYFLVKTLRVQVLSGATGAETSPYTYGGGPYAAAPNPYAGSGGGGGGGGTKRRVYFLLFVALMQPALSWWLTYHLVPPDAAPDAPQPPPPPTL